MSRITLFLMWIKKFRSRDSTWNSNLKKIEYIEIVWSFCFKLQLYFFHCLLEQTAFRYNHADWISHWFFFSGIIAISKSIKDNIYTAHIIFTQFSEELFNILSIITIDEWIFFWWRPQKRKTEPHKISTTYSFLIVFISQMFNPDSMKRNINTRLLYERQVLLQHSHGT